MIIEMLYPEIANLFGDNQNIRYLELCVPGTRVLRTALNDQPAFVTDGADAPDLIYMGPMSEQSQLRVLKRLGSHAERLHELIEGGTTMLFTGNAMDVLGRKIVNEDEGYEVEGLGLLSISARIELSKRFNGKVLGHFGQMPVVGFKSQFSYLSGDNSGCALIECSRGTGMTPGSKLEGIHLHNLYATNLLGPLLILNPLFTKHLLGVLGQPETLAFEDEIMAAFTERLKEFQDPRTHGFE